MKTDDVLDIFRFHVVSVRVLFNSTLVLGHIPTCFSEKYHLHILWLLLFRFQFSKKVQMRIC